MTVDELDELFIGMSRIGEEHPSRNGHEDGAIFEADGTGSGARVAVSPSTGDGNSTRRTFSIAFPGGQEAENARVVNGELRFDVVGAWELADLAEPLALLALFLAKRHR